MRRALVFGMATYESEALPNLPSGVADAEQVADLLRYHVGGTDNFEVTVQVSDDDNMLTVEDLMRTTDAWFDAGPITDGLIYFSGHASNTPYGLHLAGADTDGSFDAGFAFDSLLHRANQKTFASLTIILDCCHSGAAGDITLDTRFDALLLRKNVAILAASREFESAWGGDPTSQFTEQFIGALSDARIQSDGPATVFDVFQNVRVVLPTLGQTPVLKAHISTDVVLRDRN
ncbi:hypothetical protein GCM10009623_26460 [Nocardioides aestuarii]|uniref:Caspase domain-containing protein n=1 Tax=Nocardioides aestuarii TaxID=252231 RepID=A0ABW4TMM9_9ACTN